MIKEEEFLWELLSKDEPYFRDDDNGPGDWYCPLECTSVRSTWGGRPVMPQRPVPFPHTDDCLFTRVQTFLDTKYKRLAE